MSPTRTVSGYPTNNGIPVIPWHVLEGPFLNTWGRPNGKVEAQHIAIEGPSGSGKSMFQVYVAQKRVELRGSHVMVVATKPADSTLKELGWPIIRQYPPDFNDRKNFILWPPTPRDEEQAKTIQRETIRKALIDKWHEESNFIVVFDEIAYLEDELKLKTLISRYWREGRALGISIVATTQRPRNVTRYMWSEPSWLVAFQPNDEEEADRVAQILGGRKIYRDALMNLEEFQFIIVNRKEKVAYISKLNT